MNAIIYARTSCTRPNARSLDDQIGLCRTYCEREGWTVVGVFADEASGGDAGFTSRARPGLVAMLSTVESGGTDRVATETTDRIARNQRDVSAVQERVTLAGARLVTVAESDASDLTDSILALFDAAFRRDRIARFKRGRLAAGATPSGDSVA